MRSISDNVLAVKAVDPIAASAVQTSAAIDTMGYNTAMVVVQNGAATGSPSSYTVDAKIQECDTSGGSYTDITGATATQIVADAKLGTIRLEGLGTSARKRYIKVLVTPALSGGSSPKAIIGATVLLGRANQLPVTNS